MKKNKDSFKQKSISIKISRDKNKLLKNTNINNKDTNYDKIPYCENPAIGTGAPKCSEDCCNYGSCHKSAYLNYLAEKYAKIHNNVTYVSNFQFEEVTIGDRVYPKEEVFEILKKHKEEEDSKKKTCFRCKINFLKNEKVNMIDKNLGPANSSSMNNDLNFSSAFGYSISPYISGIQIQSTCGNGAEIWLCDNCIEELVNWLDKK